MKIACRSSELIFTFLFAGSRIQNASEQFVWCILSFANFALRPTPTGRTLMELGLEIQTAVTWQQFTITCVFILTPPTMADTIDSQNIDLST
jgi:hypothetical protein